ncbi:hypothetical protein HYFRA_00002712 [Hymenoscyphus fraxineus]|uniref:Uncharacterized protein n=1 Tax=Hymenoscyphus fraxineus TaxID=746836 RepID=A0A9N9L814_9HELO|nr:hypothetical protein HYFRA_00002712 [Hymenoscyphus fraxineus]
MVSANNIIRSSNDGPFDLSTLPKHIITYTQSVRKPSDSDHFSYTKARSGDWTTIDWSYVKISERKGATIDISSLNLVANDRYEIAYFSGNSDRPKEEAEFTAPRDIDPSGSSTVAHSSTLSRTGHSSSTSTHKTIRKSGSMTHTHTWDSSSTSIQTPITQSSSSTISGLDVTLTTSLSTTQATSSISPPAATSASQNSGAAEGPAMSFGLLLVLLVIFRFV